MAIGRRENAAFSASSQGFGSRPGIRSGFYSLIRSVGAAHDLVEGPAATSHDFLDEHAVEGVFGHAVLFELGHFYGQLVDLGSDLRLPVDEALLLGFSNST